MKKVFLAAILAVLVSAVFLTGCTTGEATHIKEIIVVGDDVEAVKAEMMNQLEKNVEKVESGTFVGHAMDDFRKLAPKVSISGSGTKDVPLTCTTTTPSGCNDWDCSEVTCSEGPSLFPPPK